MRKKLLTTLLVCLTTLIAAVCFTACGDESGGGTPTDVTGKTYIYSGCTVSGDNSSYYKLMIDEGYEGEEITFNLDGTVTSDSFPYNTTYKQNGSKVTLSLDGQNFSGTATGNTFTLVMSQGNIRATLKFTLVKSQGGEQEGGISSTTSVSGKTYEIYTYFVVGTVSDEELKEYEEMMEKELDGETLTFNADGTVTSQMFYGANYTQNGSKVTITIGRESVTGTIEKDTLTIASTKPDGTVTITLMYTLVTSTEPETPPQISQGSVAGTTYEFVSLEFEYDQSVSDSAKESYDYLLSVLGSEMEGVRIIFGNDNQLSIPHAGYVMTGTYTVSGSTVTIKTNAMTVEGQSIPAQTQIFTIDGDRIINKVEIESGIKMVQTYEKV